MVFNLCVGKIKETDNLLYNSSPYPITNDNIKPVVNLYISDQKAAIIKYGRIEDWDTSKVDNMLHIFDGKISFNNDISKWNTSNVLDMGNMFYNAKSFNQDISK